MNDKTSPLYWFDKPLIYSEHAILRSFQRYIPIIHFLPLDAKFEGMSNDRYCFSYFNQVSKVMILLSDNCDVVTTYYLRLKVKMKVRFKTRVPKPSKYPHKEIEYAMTEYA